MAYTEREIAAAQAIAQGFRTLNSRVEAVEGSRRIEKFQADVAEGQEMARRMGYSDADISRLEERMVSENCGNYAIARRAGLVEPSGPFLLDRIGADEFKKLMDGDDDYGFLNLSVGRCALTGRRGR